MVDAVKGAVHPNISAMASAFAGVTGFLMLALVCPGRANVRMDLNTRSAIANQTPVTGRDAGRRNV
jgi:hypothetical protein